MNFSELDLHPVLKSSLEKLGFSSATPIQTAAIPHIIEGRDVAGLAQTGTGKTAAFLLPLMERIVRARQNPEQLTEEEKAVREKRGFPDWRPNQFVLVLVPTRELAEQVFENVGSLSGESGLKAVSIYGGVSYDKQKEGLKNGVEFVIATPGRLIDLYKEHLLDLKQVRAVVFDEADRMFDMGFKDDMKFILQRIPKNRQFLVFSATLNLDVLNTAYQFGANPVEVNVSRDQAKAENVVDKIFHVGQEEKPGHLISLLRLHQPRQVIVFSNFKMNVPRISQFLNENGFPAVGISSLLTQSQRNRVIEQFKGESVNNILVATDVAARGLDIKGVDIVVNFELPDDPENYVHRIGRTGRAGEKGKAFSLVSDRDIDALTRIEQYLKHKLDTEWLEENDLIKEYKAMPSSHGPAKPYGDRNARGGESGHGSSRGDRARSSEGRQDRGNRRGDHRSNQKRRDQRDARPSQQGAGTSENGSQNTSPKAMSQRNHPGQRQQQQQGQGRAASGDSRHRRHENAGGQGRHKGRGNRPSHVSVGKHGSQRGNSQVHGKNQKRHGHDKNVGAMAANKSFGQKVSGFFKRLFGGS